MHSDQLPSDIHELERHAEQFTRSCTCADIESQQRRSRSLPMLANSLSNKWSESPRGEDDGVFWRSAARRWCPKACIGLW